MNQPNLPLAGTALEGFARSQALDARARRLFPDGVAAYSQTREPHPLYLEHAQGARLFDVDGNSYIDFMLGAGPAILGHRHPAIVEAVQSALARGLPNIAVGEQQIELAEVVTRLVPSIEQIRFLPTGTEAVQAAIRVARRATGRMLIAKFEGAYHGQAENVMVSVGVPAALRGPREAPLRVPYHCVLPDAVAAQTLVLPYNDLVATTALLEAHAKDLALVLVEPMLGFAGAIPAEAGFIHGLRAVTARLGIVLTFDEVITGFRVGLGGGQGHYGVRPDLTILGKAIGGGMPLSAFGGREDLMRYLSPARYPHDYVFQSGTFSGLPLSVAAGLAALRVLEQGGAEHVCRLGDRARQGLVALTHRLGIPACVTGLGSLFHLHLTDQVVTDARSAEDADHERLRQLHTALLAHGCYFYAGRLGFLSTAHTEADIDHMLGAVAAELGD